MRSHALGTPGRSCARGVFCGPAFPLAHPLPSIPSASGVSPSPGPLGAPWPSPAFPPSCPFRSAMGPCSSSVALCSGTSSVLRGSQTPCSVHRWIASSDFPPRPATPSPRAGAGSPGSRAWRFHACSGSRRRPRQVPLYLAIIGAADVAFSPGNSLGTWKLNSISRLNTRPACAPVNASGIPLRVCPHDSGSSWVASPSMCEFLLRYAMPVYPGASPGKSGPGTGTSTCTCTGR
jgi:hypothetical protein